MLWTILNRPSDYRKRYVAVTTAINAGVRQEALRVFDAVEPTDLHEHIEFEEFIPLADTALERDDVSRVLSYCLVLREVQDGDTPELLISDSVYPLRLNRFRMPASYYTLGTVTYRHLQNYLRSRQEELHYLVCPSQPVARGRYEDFLWNTLCYGPCPLHNAPAVLVTPQGASWLLTTILGRLASYASGTLQAHVFGTPMPDATGCFALCEPVFGEYPKEIFDDSALEYYALAPSER